jgi:metacaspase-1
MLSTMLVAINRYPDAPLRGCINDAVEASGVAQAAGCPISGLHSLFDELATTRGILDNLGRLVHDAVPGDILYFHFSGHGSQIEDPSEVDGLAEIICPYNFAWTPSRMIRDDQLVELFRKLKPGVKLYWLSDSCHSGGLSSTQRDIHASRTYPGTRRYIQSGKSAHDRVADAGLNCAFISGCTSKQTSADTSINNIWRGAFSYYFFQAVRELPGKSVLTLVRRCNRLLAEAGYEQRAQASGPLVSSQFLK